VATLVHLHPYHQRSQTDDDETWDIKEKHNNDDIEMRFSEFKHHISSLLACSIVNSTLQFTSEFSLILDSDKGYEEEMDEIECGNGLERALNWNEKNERNDESSISSSDFPNLSNSQSCPTTFFHQQN